MMAQSFPTFDIPAKASWSDVLKGATSDKDAIKAIKAAIMVQLIMIPIRMAIKGIIG